MRELSLKEIEMVSGGMEHDIGKTTGGGNNTGNMMLLGALGNSSYYLSNDPNPTLMGTVQHGLTGAIGGGTASRFKNLYSGAAIGGSATGGLDKTISTINKTGDNYNRKD